MAFICGDCKKEHPVPTPQEDLDGSPCFDALLRDRDRLLLQVEELQKKLAAVRALFAETSTDRERKLDLQLTVIRDSLRLQSCGCSMMTDEMLAHLPGQSEKRIELPQKITGCGVCGGKLAMIRGKFPGQPDREVCPTCATEKMEDFKISSQQPAQPKKS